MWSERSLYPVSASCFTAFQTCYYLVFLNILERDILFTTKISAYNMTRSEQTGSAWGNPFQMILFAFLLSALACELYSLMYWIRVTYAISMDMHGNRMNARLATNAIQDFPVLVEVFSIAHPIVDKTPLPLPSASDEIGTRLCELSLSRITPIMDSRTLAGWKILYALWATRSCHHSIAKCHTGAQRGCRAFTAGCLC